MESFSVRRGEVTIPVTVAGEGPAAVFVPGLWETQADLGPLFEILRGSFRLATFDHRGHGLSSAAASYDYPSFTADAAAVLDALVHNALGSPESLVLMGHSLGGDLILDYAAALPKGPLGLVLVDGGTPLSYSLLTEDELADMHASLSSEGALLEQESLAGTPRRVLLSADAVLRLQREIDHHRRSATERFDQVEGPITMIMSEFMAGASGDRALEINAGWRDAVDVLATDRPSIRVHRLPAGHDLVVTHPDQVAALARAACAGEGT
jgi:esterase